MDGDSNIFQHSHTKQGLTPVYKDPRPSIGLYTHKLNPELHLCTFKPQTSLLEKGTLVDYFFS